MKKNIFLAFLHFIYEQHTEYDVYGSLFEGNIMKCSCLGQLETIVYDIITCKLAKPINTHAHTHLHSNNANDVSP